MLIESKVKVARIIEGKTKNVTETYIVDKDFFAEAEYAVTALLTDSTDEFEIQSLRLSPIKEIANQFTGNYSFVATLRDTWMEDDDTEKHLKYKVLLWADTLTQANQRVQELAKEGYDMLIEGIKQVDYEYIA